jgi:hypothetical protein
MYIELVNRGFPADAQRMFSKYKNDHEAEHAYDVWDYLYITLKYKK